MRATNHIRLLILGAVCWLLFWLLGLPAYYQQYSTPSMLFFSAVVTVGIAAVGFFILWRARPDRRLDLAGWICFYFTVPLALLDYLYCGLYLGVGLWYLVSYWYLTAFYVIPWLVLLPMAKLLSRTSRGIA